MKLETRYFDTELRALTEGDNKVIEGRFLNYDVDSKYFFENGKWFTEVIERGAADKDTKTKDAFLTYNHSKDNVNATVKSGSLAISFDEKGGSFRAILNNTTHSNNLYELVLRGDVNGNSFGFRSADKGDKWSRNANGENVRRISRISEIREISVIGGLLDPVYPQTVVYARGFDEFEKDIPTKIKEDNIEPYKEFYEDEIRILKLKNKF